MMIFAGGVYVSENTSQAASVEFVGHRHTNYARRQTESPLPENPMDFQASKPPPTGGGSFASSAARLPPAVKKSKGFFTAALLPRQNPLQ